jgi:acetyl esterase/lipase
MALELGLLLICCTLTAIPWKFIRFVLDAQYGKSAYKISLGGDTVTDLSSSSTTTTAPRVNLSTAISSIERYMQRLRVLGCVTWPRLEEFARQWDERESVAGNGSKYLRARRQRRLQRTTKDAATVTLDRMPPSEEVRTSAPASPPSPPLFQAAKELDQQQQQQPPLSSTPPSNSSAPPPPPSKSTSVILFVHGGALISGSPYKHNTYNWITTIAHFSDYDTLLLPIYSLAPEVPAPHALIDIVCTLLQHVHECELENVQVHKLCWIGFSAGCFLLLQLYQLFYVWYYIDEKAELFGVSVASLPPKSFSRTRIGTILQSLRSVQLCSGLYRTDSLYLNDRIDVSTVLRAFMYVYTTRPLRDDPLLSLTKLVKKNGWPDKLPKIRLYDVNVNSLSNHSVQLHAILPSSHLHVFDSTFFKVDSWLIKHGNLERHKFTRNLRTMKSERGKIIDSIHYHFFPFIVCTDAARATMKTIQEDLWTL